MTTFCEQWEKNSIAAFGDLRSCSEMGSFCVTWFVSINIMVSYNDYGGNDLCVSQSMIEIDSRVRAVKSPSIPFESA